MKKAEKPASEGHPDDYQKKRKSARRRNAATGWLCWEAAANLARQYQTRIGNVLSATGTALASQRTSATSWISDLQTTIAAVCQWLMADMLGGRIQPSLTSWNRRSLPIRTSAVRCAPAFPHRQAAWAQPSPPALSAPVSQALAAIRGRSRREGLRARQRAPGHAGSRQCHLRYSRLEQIGELAVDERRIGQSWNQVSAPVPVGRLPVRIIEAFRKSEAKPHQRSAGDLTLGLDGVHDASAILRHVHQHDAGEPQFGINIDDAAIGRKCQLSFPRAYS